MKIFEALAFKIESEWMRAQRSLDSFPDVATLALRDFHYDLSLEQLKSVLVEWFLKNTSLPEQLSVHNTFGQPSITVFNNGQFVIDLYIWVNFDTSIHSHGFRGAFRVLHGISLQESFQFKNVGQVSRDIMTIDMSEVRADLLRAGDVCRISPGLELTHSVVHLAEPTVTLCVRTINEPEIKQWTFMNSGLAVQKQNVSTALVKKVYYFNFLMSQNTVFATDFLNSFLDQLDISTQIHLYEDVASGALDLSAAAVDALTSSIVRRHEPSIWWPRYEAAYLGQAHELFFTNCNEPDGRLIAHLINRGLWTSQLREIFSKLTDRSVTAVIKDLIKLDEIFGQEVEEQDRHTIEELIDDLKMSVPAHLQEIQQIGKIRDFLQQCKSLE